MPDSSNVDIYVKMKNVPTKYREILLIGENQNRIVECYYFTIKDFLRSDQMSDIKERLLRVINDPHFSRRERQLAESSLKRIEELESEDITDWTEKAKNALIKEVHNKVIGKQAATKIGSFLKRQI